MVLLSYLNILNIGSTSPFISFNSNQITIFFLDLSLKSHCSEVRPLFASSSSSKFVKISSKSSKSLSTLPNSSLLHSFNLIFKLCNFLLRKRPALPKKKKESHQDCIKERKKQGMSKPMYITGQQDIDQKKVLQEQHE